MEDAFDARRIVEDVLKLKCFSQWMGLERV
jgi:hypothetical protein